MTRTNIDIDDELVENVMRAYNLPTKRAAIDFALRRAYVPRLSKTEILAMAGTGWEGDIETIRDTTPEARK